MQCVLSQKLHEMLPELALAGKASYAAFNSDSGNMMFKKEDLLSLAQDEMPFGKFSGRRIIDLPEEYLLWFREKGFPEGRLGMLMALALEIKMEGLEGLIEPLKGVKSRMTFH